MAPEVFADKLVNGDWRVEHIHEGEGVVDVAIFSGPHAERLARTYHAWLQGNGALMRLVPPEQQTKEQP